MQLLQNVAWEGDFPGILCNAGKNTFFANDVGDIFICFDIRQKVGNIYQHIDLGRDITYCALSRCTCPQYKQDKGLNDKAFGRQTERADNTPYDAWIHWSINLKCYFECLYCSAGKGGADKKYSDLTEPVDIDAIIRTLEKTGKVFRISFTGGGEPFMVENIVELCVALTKKHYITFNTNFVHKNVGRLIESVPSDKILHLHASAHFLDLQKKGRFELYFENYKKCKERGIQVNNTAVAYPGYLNDGKLSDYIQQFTDNGIKVYFGPFIGEYEGRSYPEAYTDREMDIFDIRNKISRHTPKQASTPAQEAEKFLTGP